MANNTKSTEISTILEKRYHQKVKVTELRSGRDKDVYLAKFSDEREFAVLVNKRKTIMRKYRTILSNDFQKKLFQKGVNVPDVIDLFEQKNGIIIACHTYIKGSHIEKLDENTAWQCGEIVARLHTAVMVHENYDGRYPFKYKLCRFVKFFTDLMRLAKVILTDKQILQLPSGLCHRDLNLTNFIFTNDRVCLIDFDRHRLCPFAYEIGRFLKGEGNSDYAADFLRGYSSIRELTDKERFYLYRQFSQLSYMPLDATL